MLNKVINVIKKYNLIEKNDKIVIGVSGGSDSMTLLHILNSIKDEFGFEIIACHINHGTRNGESDSDADFVDAKCKELGIKVYSFAFNLEEESKNMKVSCEEAGRKLRYDSFYKVLKDENANKIATAHNLNDNAETILLNVFRGTGLNGLCGIPVKKGEIIRPLIECSKSEIENYAKENKIIFKEDYTNKETVFTRNKIRNELLPYVTENINDNVLNNLNKMASILNDEKDLIDSMTSRAYSEVTSSYYESHTSDDGNGEMQNKSILKIDLIKLSDYHVAIKKRVLKRAITIVNGESFKDLSLTHIDSVLDIISKGTGKQITILNGITCQVNYDTLLIFKDKTPDDNNSSDSEDSDNNNEVKNTNKNANKNLAGDKDIKYSVTISNESFNYPAPLKEDASKALVVSSNKTSREDNKELKEDTNLIKVMNKNIYYRVLSEEETDEFKKKLESSKSFEKELDKMSKTKMFFDLDMITKKTNIIATTGDDGKGNTLENKNTKLLYKFRKREDGDKIQIDSDNHFKKLKDLFIDEKIERDVRNKIIVFEKVEKDSNDNILNEDIIALLGRRINPKYKVKENTNVILEVKFDM